MAPVTKLELQRTIRTILNEGNLDELTAKKIRILCEQKFNVDLSSRKGEIDKVVMQFVDEQCKAEKGKPDEEGYDRSSHGSDSYSSHMDSEYQYSTADREAKNERKLCSTSAISAQKQKVSVKQPGSVPVRKPIASKSSNKVVNSQNRMLKRRTKANIHFNDQDSQKRMAVKTEDIASTSGMRKDFRSVDGILDGFKQGSQIRMKGHKSSAHKITKCMTDNLVSSGCNIEMKKLQIILTRCDDKDFNLHNESAVEFNNSSREYDGIKSKSETGKKRLKDSSKKNAREMKDILEIIDDVQKDDVEICRTSINNSGPSEIKSNSLKRSKKNRENNGEIDISPEKIEIIHSKNKFRNGDVKRELKVNLEKYISIPENDKSLKLCGDSESSVDADEKAKNVPNETGKCRKRKKGGEEQDDNDTKPAKSAKKEKDSDKSKSSKEKTHDVTSIDFANDSKNSSGKKCNSEISSCNVSGIRTCLEEADDAAYARKLQAEQWNFRQKTVKNLFRNLLQKKNYKNEQAKKEKVTPFNRKCLLSSALAEVLGTNEVKKVLQTIDSQSLPSTSAEFDPSLGSELSTLTSRSLQDSFADAICNETSVPIAVSM